MCFYTVKLVYFGTISLLIGFAASQFQFNNPFNYPLFGSPGPYQQNHIYNRNEHIHEQTTLTPQTETSCDQFWSYKSDYSGHQYGEITIPIPDYRTSELKVELLVAAHLPSQDAGGIELPNGKNAAVNDIANGLPLRFHVRFPIQNPVPTVTKIFYNNQLICSASGIGSYVYTKISLEYSLYTTLTHPPYRRVSLTTQPTTSDEGLDWKIEETTSRPRTVTPRTRRPVSTTESFETVDDDFECGVPEIPLTTGLVFGGKNSVRGQFPWLAAYYHNGRTGFDFVCGGSLVSTKVVVTAAHCVQKKGDVAIRKAEEATIFLGKYELASNAERNVFVSGASEICMHPDWDFNVKEYDADMAVIILKQSVTFTKFVKPICIWRSTTSYQDILWSSGVVAGWGKTESLPADVPRWTKIPIVNETVCWKSNSAFRELTSYRTFCAGDRERESIPCNGDSGTGLLIKDDNKWYLRGIVSSSLIDQSTVTCDATNYAVFTDAASFTSWILGFIEKHG